MGAVGFGFVAIRNHDRDGRQVDNTIFLVLRHPHPAILNLRFPFTQFYNVDSGDGGRKTSDKNIGRDPGHNIVLGGKGVAETI